jgi:hypothetical protein
MSWLATDKQHGQYAICSAKASQSAFVTGTVVCNGLAPKYKAKMRAL